MKKANKKLSVSMQTVRDLTFPEAARVDGGTLYYVAREDVAELQARPNKCTCNYSGCTQSGR